MRIITKIAKNELRNLFYSPIAWFLMIILLLLCAYAYTGVMYQWAKGMEVLYKNQPWWPLQATESITFSLFSDAQQNGYIPYVMGYIYLFVPLLTMNIINREFNNGSIRLLYSSPVKLRQIVLGKYLALAFYNFLMVCIVGIFMVLAFTHIQALDYPLLLSGALGIYLFLCALTAIGFFMSSLSTYQIVSAIASFTVLFVLDRIGGLWQEYDFVRDLTYFLSVVGRSEKMVAGLIRSKDVLYFLIIICMFVSFTLLKLKAGLQFRPWYVKLGQYLAVALVALFAGYISSRPQFTLYYDATARKVNTIHPRTQDIIQQLDKGPLEVTLYSNLFDERSPQGFPSSRNAYLENFWEKYQRFKTGIDFKYEYYYANPPGDSTLFKNFPGKTPQQIAGLVAKIFRQDSALFKSPSAIQNIGELEKEDYRLIMKLRYNGQTCWLRTFRGNVWPDEQVVNAALLKLLQAPSPKVYFVTGELERSIYKRGEREFYGLANGKEASISLINTGFQSDSINLQLQNIPADAGIVVLADPRIELSEPVLNKLKNYIAGGGNMLVFGEPGKQYVLNPLLSSIGVQLENGQLVEPSLNETPDKVSYYFNYAGLSLADEFWMRKYKYYWDNKLFRDSFMFKMNGVTGLKFQDSLFTSVPLDLTLPGRSWLKTGKLITDSSAPVFNAAEGDRYESTMPVVAAFTRKIQNREQRIIVSGDADIGSNFRLMDELVRGMYSWLVYNKYPVYTNIPYAKDNVIIVKGRRAWIEKIFFTWILPALMLITGIIILVRRKRK